VLACFAGSPFVDVVVDTGGVRSAVSAVFVEHVGADEVVNRAAAHALGDILGGHQRWAQIIVMARATR
jgi:hypothetical protein